MKKTTQRITSILLAMVLLLGLSPATVLAAETGLGIEDITVTVTMNTQSVADDVSNYGLTPLPESAEVTVPADSTVAAVMQQWATDTKVALIADKTGYITKIGEFGNKDSGAVDYICGNAGLDPVPEIFNNAGWTYTINGEMGMGGANADKVASNDTLAFRYGVYMTTGTWQQMDHIFLDAYNSLAKHLTEATQVQDPSAQLKDAIAAAQGVKDAIDGEAYGMWLNYWAEKITTVSNVVGEIQRVDTALINALAGKATPEEVTILENDPVLVVGTPYQIQYKIGPEGAPQDAIFEPILNEDCYTVSDTGIITPGKACSGKGMIFVTCKSNSNLKGSLRFTIVEPEPDPVLPSITERMESLLSNIAKSYVNNTGEWQVMDMGAYALAHPEGTKLSDAAKQTYINQAIASISDGKANDQKYAKAILALKSQGIDPTQLYPVNSNTAMSAIAGLNGIEHSTSLWSAPYTLMAYRQGNYNTAEQENALVDALLSSQKENGSWDEWGTIDTTANTIAALSLYSDNERAAQAVEKGIDYLSKQQKDTGAFDDGYGANSNSMAMVVVGLAAAGINPHTDARFIKNGHSAMDALLSFALTDNSGFGYTDNKMINAAATEQSFRALVAAEQVMKTGAAFNVYDFSKVPAKAGRATGEGGQNGGEVTPAPDADTITVTVTIKADTGYWLNSKPVTVKDGSSVADAFLEAIQGTGISQVGAENGYISSMTKDGRTLAEFTNGPDSGWLYKVNGVLPDKGIGNFAVSSKDNIVFYYTNDWTKDPSAGQFKPNDKIETTENPDGSITTTVTKPDGSTVATTKELNGTTVVVETRKDGAVSTTETRTDGVKVQTKTDTKGATTAEVTVPEGKNSVSVSVPMQQKPTDSMVLVIVKPDGTEEIVKKSVSDGKSVSALVDSSCTMKVIDNTKAFTDTNTHWAADAIAFASSHELFNGVSATRFAPNDTMDRSMLATVFYRLEGEVAASQNHAFGDVAENTWYTDAVSWASDNGIVTGYGDGNFGTRDAITREQLAVMLYRYADVIHMDTNTTTSGALNKFEDDQQVSPWAADAVEWAVSCGIIDGVGDGHLAPKNTATRAQVASMMQRFIKQMVL